mgnify:FL=1
MFGTSFLYSFLYSLPYSNERNIWMKTQITTIIKRKSVILTTAIILFLSACGGADSDAPAAKNKELAPPVEFDYQQLIENTISENVHGIILQINTPEREFIGSAGVSDRDNQTPMQTTDVFSIQSAGKVITALLAAQLHDEALLNLDHTLDTWLPLELLDQIQYSEQITLRQLLNHSSGIVDYNDNEMFIPDLLASPEVQRGNSDLVN